MLDDYIAQSVLIDTQWNVNNIMWQVLTIFLCFNRYIVECKFVWGRYRNTGREMIERMIQLFTFHYVSIKTMKILFFTLYLLHLHSTMYLLKLPAISKITSFYSVFTFHYVSIKTKTRLSVRSIQNYLHSTMYLLKPVTLRNNHFLHTIYIPLCIY